MDPSNENTELYPQNIKQRFISAIDNYIQNQKERRLERHKNRKLNSRDYTVPKGKALSIIDKADELQDFQLEFLYMAFNLIRTFETFTTFNLMDNFFWKVLKLL